MAGLFRRMVFKELTPLDKQISSMASLLSDVQISANPIFCASCSSRSQRSCSRLGVVMRAKHADGNAGGYARQDFKFLRAHVGVKSIGRKRIGDQREERPLRRELFHQRGGIAATIAQNVNRSQRQGAFRESQFLFSQVKGSAFRNSR